MSVSKHLTCLLTGASLSLTGCAHTQNNLQGLLTPSQYQSESYPQPGSIDSLVLNFPDKIPHAARVEKYIHPGSSEIIVHIRQIHQAEGELWPLQRESVEKVQEDIYEILEYFRTYQNTQVVYSEGVTPESLLKIRSDENFLRVFKVLESPEGKARGWSKPTDLYHAQIDSFREEYALTKDPKISAFISELEAFLETAGESIDFQYAELLDLQQVNSPLRYTFRYPGSIRPTENLELALKVMQKPFEKMNSEEKEDLIFDGREDHAIHLALNDETNASPYHIIVYGGAHNFLGPSNPNIENEEKRRNIQRWNASNPSQRASLIVITPSSYDSEWRVMLDRIISWQKSKNGSKIEKPQ